jgi:N-acetylglucosamine-6-sulfatase
MGKQHPYNTDVVLPLYIRGPGLPANTTLLHPTTHIDITATVVDLAGATPVGPPLDGKSFRGILTANPPSPQSFRNFTFSEHFGGDLTWWKIRFPFEGTEMHWWCTNTPEVFDTNVDPWELTNLASTPRGSEILNATLPLTVWMGKCKGVQCNTAPTESLVIGDTPLSCKQTAGTGWRDY